MSTDPRWVDGPLVLAAKEGDGDKMLLLLRKGCNVHDTDVCKRSLYEIIKDGPIYRDNALETIIEQLLHELLLKKAAPPDFTLFLYDWKLEEGKLLRRRLPHYLKNREKFVHDNCALPAVLRNIVLAYDWLTVDACWETGLGTATDETKWRGPKIPEEPLILTHKRQRKA